MITRSRRSMTVALTPLSLTVGFSWFERDEVGKMEMKNKWIDCLQPETLNGIRVRLNSLNVRAYVACIDEKRFSLIFDFNEPLEGFYDTVVQSEHPEIAFITPYEIVLQPHEQPVNVQ